MRNLFILFLVVISFLSCQPKKEVLTIAAASNTQFAMVKLVEVFKKETGYPCEVVISSSGKLSAQVKEGAPFDVFCSADLKYPNELFNTGYTRSKPKVYAHGKLVMWSLSRVPTIPFLAGQKIKHIALASPKTAPYGGAAMEVINYYGLRPYLKDKLVFGESISQVNQFVSTGSVDLGFTAMSVVLSPEMKDIGYWLEVDPDVYNPIAQGVVTLDNDKKLKVEADAFVDFLFSESGNKILKEFGYLVK